MRVNMISRFVRQLSGQGALDNVVRGARGPGVDRRRAQRVRRRGSPPVPIAAETPAAA